MCPYIYRSIDMQLLHKVFIYALRVCSEQVEIGADFSTPKAGECRDATQRSYSPLSD